MRSHQNGQGLRSLKNALLKIKCVNCSLKVKICYWKLSEQYFRNLCHQKIMFSNFIHLLNFLWIKKADLYLKRQMTCEYFHEFVYLWSPAHCFCFDNNIPDKVTVIIKYIVLLHKLLIVWNYNSVLHWPEVNIVYCTSGDSSPWDLNKMTLPKQQFGFEFSSTSIPDALTPEFFNIISANLLYSVPSKPLLETQTFSP